MTVNHKWLLPDGVLEVLPGQAEQLEQLRRDTLDLYRSRGYELVFPPLIEYLESLLITSDPELDLRTLKVTDQISGRLLGIRADITPQVARIDAHSLAQSRDQQQVNRLCYAGSVLHAMPLNILAPRTLVQTGVEIYGHEGIASDREALEVMIAVFNLADSTAEVTINVGHAGLYKHILGEIFGEASKNGRLHDEEKASFLEALKKKNLGDLMALVRKWGLSSDRCSLLNTWVSLQGGVEVLDVKNKCLREDHYIRRVLDDLKQTLTPLMEDNNKVSWFFDLSELQSYAYHTGLVYAAYPHYAHTAIASGGRYDGLGKEFGATRASTGFSADLMSLVELRRLRDEKSGVSPDERGLSAIWAPLESDPSRAHTLRKKIDDLRSSSEVVIQALSDQDRPKANQRFLAFEHDDWVVK